jgi:hypothetical protein
LNQLSLDRLNSFKELNYLPSLFGIAIYNIVNTTSVALLK